MDLELEHQIRMSPHLVACSTDVIHELITSFPYTDQLSLRQYLSVIAVDSSLSCVKSETKSVDNLNQSNARTQSAPVNCNNSGTSYFLPDYAVQNNEMTR